MRKFHLTTYGCQMNKNDSERIAGLLDNLGFEQTEKMEEADAIIINTCSVRQTAEDRVFGSVEKFSLLKEKNPELIICVTGCMPGRDKDGSLRAKVPIVDFFFPIADLNKLPKWLAEHFPEIVNSEELKDDYLKLQPLRKNNFQAFVTVQTGCNKFCAYCVVPFARGLERNRPVADIISEIKDLAYSGCVDITLLGQTVNSFRASDPENFSNENPYHDHFAALLWEVNQIAGIERVHFTAPHPIHMSDEAIDALALPKQVNFIHLPVQAGDDEVLRRMNRRYGAKQYLEIIKKIKAKVPGIAIGTDIIVGFPGETEEQFEKTVELYRQAEFDISYTAIYSERTGTVAHKVFKEAVPFAEKRRRWRVLQELMEKIVLEKNQKYVDQTLLVMVEKCEPINPKLSAENKTLSYDVCICSGNSREMKIVQFLANENLAGKIVPVKIVRAREWILEGIKS